MSTTVTASDLRYDHIDRSHPRHPESERHQSWSFEDDNTYEARLEAAIAFGHGAVEALDEAYEDAEDEAAALAA